MARLHGRFDWLRPGVGGRAPSPRFPKLVGSVLVVVRDMNVDSRSSAETEGPAALSAATACTSFAPPEIFNHSNKLMPEHRRRSRIGILCAKKKFEKHVEKSLALRNI